MNHHIDTEIPQADQRLLSSDRIFDAKELLGNAREVQIKLDSQIYTLRRTRFGKLLLTK